MRRATLALNLGRLGALRYAFGFSVDSIFTSS